jgi:general secretion pathway protein G
MTTLPHPRALGRTAPGFSLIELTLVIVILGVLMSVVAVNVIGQGERAKIGATKTTMDTIQTQLNAYHLEYNAYPPQLELLQQVDGFLSASKPIEDGWRRKFLYTVPGSKSQPYDLISNGGDETDIADDIDIWTMNLH